MIRFRNTRKHTFSRKVDINCDSMMFLLLLCERLKRQWRKAVVTCRGLAIVQRSWQFVVPLTPITLMPSWSYRTGHREVSHCYSRTSTASSSPTSKYFTKSGLRFVVQPHCRSAVMACFCSVEKCQYSSIQGVASHNRYKWRPVILQDDEDISAPGRFPQTIPPR